MKRLAAVFVFIVLVIFDGAAVGLAISLPVLAVLLHLIIAGMAYGTVKAFTAPNRRGRRTLALFCGLICLITPVLGCIAAAILLQSLEGKTDKSEPPQDFAVGNPRAKINRPPVKNASVGEPLIYAFVHAPSSNSHHLAIPLLRHPLDRKAVTLLQKLRSLGDARTRLFARSALTSSVESREHTLDKLRRRTTASPDSSEAHLQLAEMLFSTAESGVFGDLQHNRLFVDAGHHFAIAAKLNPASSSAIFGKGMTLIRQNELDNVPEWYGRLLAVPDDPDKLAPRLEAELFAASGNWERTSGAAGKLPNLSRLSRRFWKAQ